MRLKAVSVRRVGGGVRGVQNSRTRWGERCGALVTLESTAGLVGQGEASPLPGYSSEGLDEVEEALRGFFAEGADFPEDPGQIEALTGGLTLPSARFAAETALLDLAARAQGLPLHRLLRGGEVAPVPRSGLLTEAGGQALHDEALGKASRGLRCLKVKIGQLDVDAELGRLWGLRGALGEGVSLRLDANGSLSVGAWGELCAGLRGCGVELIEEPVGWPALGSLGAGEIPWAADESLGQHAGELLAHGGCGALVLKPAMLGFFGALRLAEGARAAGKGLIVTHLFDGPVALAAACELALILGGPGLLPCGLDPHGGLAAFPGGLPPQLAGAGLVTPSSRAGLGMAGVAS